MTSFTPKETYARISDISIDYLKDDLNIKGLIFDFDGTLRVNKTISMDTLHFLKRAKSAGFKISVLSNNPHVSNTILKTLSISTTKKFAFKPLKKPFFDMAKRMKLEPSRIAVIGNNKLADIWGANRAGMYSIYIQNRDSFLYKKRIENILKNSGIKHIE